MRTHHRPSSAHPAVVLSLAVGLSALLLPSWTAFAAELATGTEAIQPVASIEQAAKTLAMRELGGGDPATLEVQPVDPRLRYAACQGPLGGGMAPGMRSQSRMTVEVRCAEPHWRIYIGVTLHTLEHVVVTTHPLMRQVVLGPGDLTVVEREITLLPGGFYRSPEALYGTVTGRMLGTGEVLTPTVVQIPPVIRRGQQVTVVARHGGLEVRQAGVALADAGLAQRVQVQTGAGRGTHAIEGVVRAADLVEVALP